MIRALLAAVAGALLVATVAVSTQEPASAPLMVGGRKYVVAWDCWPADIAAGLGSVNPCYVEELHVQGVRRDGWVVVKDRGGVTWTINPARALAIAPAKPPQLASR
jgi:hypothetical protein